MNPLVTKIQEVVEMIERLYQATYEYDEVEIDGKIVKVPPSDVGLNEAEFDQFQDLAESIYDGAARKNWDRHLPQVDKFRAEYPNVPSWLQFATPLNLPGWWTTHPTTYVTYPNGYWLQALRTVARLAADAVEAVWLGDGRVQVSGETITLESQLADVLQSLVELQSATTPQLQTASGRDNACKLLKKIVTDFPALGPYIRFPGKRGAGGYSTTIKGPVSAPLSTPKTVV